MITSHNFTTSATETHSKQKTQQYNEVKDKQFNRMVEQVEPCQSHVNAFLCRFWEEGAFLQSIYLWQGQSMNTVFDNTSTCPRNLGPTTPVRRGRGRNLKPHWDISVESPYFSPSKERPPRPKGENFLIVERLQLLNNYY